MKKIIFAVIPTIALVFFVAIMLSGSYLKQPLGKDDNVPKLIDVVIKNVEDKKWNEADKNLKRLDNAWSKVVKRIQFSSERNEITALSQNLTRLQGAIIAKNDGLALVELKDAYGIWEDLAW